MSRNKRYLEIHRMFSLIFKKIITNNVIWCLKILFSPPRNYWIYLALMVIFLKSQRLNFIILRILNISSSCVGYIDITSKTLTMFLMAWYFLISRWRSLICWLFESDTCFEVISENDKVAVSSMTNGDIAHTYIVIYQLCFHNKRFSIFLHFPELFPENSHHVCPLRSVVHHHLHVHQAHHTMFIMFVQQVEHVQLAQHTHYFLHKKNSQELWILSGSLSDCQSLTLNVMFPVSQFVS